MYTCMNIYIYICIYVQKGPAVAGEGGGKSILYTREPLLCSISRKTHM